MENIPALDHQYLHRIGFVQDADGSFSRSIEGVEVCVYDTGRGFLRPSAHGSRISVQFKTVTHLKWFMDAFK